MKITFTMASPQPKKNSTRFDREAIEEVVDADATAPWVQGFKPSFYIPKPVAENAPRIRVTIEELS